MIENTDRIKLLEQGILDLDTQIVEYNTIIDKLHDITYIDVENEFDYAKANGETETVKHLSNEKKRGIEVNKRLNVIKEYIDAVESVSVLEREKREAEIELNADRRQFIINYCQNKIPI
jgi:hypothetical protein